MFGKHGRTFQCRASIFEEVTKIGNHVANTTALTQIRIPLFFFPFGNHWNVPLLMAGFRIICCSELEPQTPSEFSLLVVMTEPLSTSKQAGRETLEAAAHCNFLTRNKGRAPGRVGGRAAVLEEWAGFQEQSTQPSPEFMFAWGPRTRQILSRPVPCILLEKKATNQRKRLIFWKPSANLTVVFQECLEH